MSDYSQVNDYSAKDALASGNPEKLILGSDVDDELSGISVAVATKYDSGDLASQAQAEAETSNVVLMTPLRVANWADANAGIVGDLQALADPNADRIIGWDDSAGAAIGFTLSTGLTTSGTNLLIDTTVVPQLAAANVWTSGQTVQAAGSINTVWKDTTAGNDQKTWGVISQSGSAYIGASYTDAGAFVEALLIGAKNTSGEWTSLAIAADAITLNGVASTDFARLSQAVTFASTLASGAATLASASITGAATVGTTLGVTGALTAATLANSTSTTLVAGQLHFITGNATLPNLTAGQWIELINDSASDITISKNASDTTYWTATGASVSTSFTLSARGRLSAVCSPAGSVVYVSGNISAAT